MIFTEEEKYNTLTASEGKMIYEITGSSDDRQLFKLIYLPKTFTEEMCLEKYAEIYESLFSTDASVFTKLQIRRALRALGKEELLNNALQNEAFKADWYDAQDIDLNDQLFLQAFKQLGLTQELLQQVVAKIKEG